MKHALRLISREEKMVFESRKKPLYFCRKALNIECYFQGWSSAMNNEQRFKAFFSIEPIIPHTALIMKRSLTCSFNSRATNLFHLVQTSFHQS